MAKYPINKGVGRQVEFKGLRAQYLFLFAGGLRLEPFELHAAPDALIDRVLHGGHAYRKNERSTVALTIRKMHAPNQLAAVLLVSGSPDENLL